MSTTIENGHGGSGRRGRGRVQAMSASLAEVVRCLLLVAAFATPSIANPETEDARVPRLLSLEWCLERARDANPVLAGSAALAAAEHYRIGPAGAFEDPRIAYEASNLPTGDFDFKSTPLSGHQFGLRQKLPFPGLRSSRREVARRRAEASSLQVRDQQLRIDGAVEAAWSELGFSQQALEITQRNIALLRQLAATAESRYRVGSGLQQDVLRAQVQLTVLLQEELRRRESIARAEARLVELLDLPHTTTLPGTTGLQLAADTPPLSPLLDSLPGRSALLGAVSKRVEEARRSVRVAELEGMPDVDLGIGYRLRERVPGDSVDGDDFVSAGLTIRLPLDRSKWRARISENRALLRKAEAELRATRAALVSRTRSAHAELVRASSEEALLETGLVPQAEQSLLSSRSAYEVGRIEFLSLLDSQVRLLDAELELERARADKRLAFAALESAAGEKLR